MKPVTDLAIIKRFQLLKTKKNRAQKIINQLNSKLRKVDDLSDAEHSRLHKQYEIRRSVNEIMEFLRGLAFELVSSSNYRIRKGHTKIYLTRRPFVIGYISGPHDPTIRWVES